MLPAALALVQVVGCGTPSDPQTTESTSQPTVNTTDTSSSPTSSGPGTSTTDPTTDTPTTDTPTTDASTTAGPGSCAELCERTTACTDELPLEQCLAGCASAEEGLLTCLFACDQDECQALLSCTTLCAQPGDPDAEPYDDCGEGPGSCQPGVLVCLNSAYPGDPNEYTACAPYCDEEGKCPVPASGDATPTCDTETIPAVCYLSCKEEGQLCPDGMVCSQGVCMWVKG